MKVVLGGQISLGKFDRGGHYFQGDNKNCDTGIVFFLLDRSYAIYSNAQSIEGVGGPYILVRWSGPVRRIYTPITILTRITALLSLLAILTGMVFFLLDRFYVIYSNAQSIEGVRGPYILVRWSGPVRRIYTPHGKY